MTAQAPEKLNKETAQREFTAAAAAWGYQRQLPDIAREELKGLRATADTYEEIARDPEASAALLLVVYMVLADPVQLRPTVSAPAEGEKDPRYDMAVKVKEHCDRTICGLKRPVKDTLEMMLKPCLTFGNKIAEKVYKIPTDGPDAYKLVLDYIHVKARGSLSFVVDDCMNLLGLVPSRFASAQKLPAGTRLIDAEKFVVMTFRMQDENPQGRSFFYSIVTPWHVKQLTWPELLTFLMRCAIPGLIAILSENAKDQILRDKDGNPVLVGDEVVKVDAITDMLTAIAGFKNSSGLVAENGTDFKPLEVTSNGEVFERAFNLLNGEITKGTLLQQLATADAEHQTKGSTGEQMGIVELLVWSIKNWVSESVIRNQILYPQVVYNFGEQAAREFTPYVTLGDYERKDWADDADAVVKLIEALTLTEDGNQIPVLTPSQIQALLAQIGLPAPTKQEIAAIALRAKQRKAEQDTRQAEQKKQDQGVDPNQPVKQ